MTLCAIVEDFEPATLDDFESWAKDVKFHPQLRADIVERYGEVPQQSDKIVSQVVKRIERAARKSVAPSAVVHPFGSTVNGFGAKSSDLDVLVGVPDEELSFHMAYVAWSRRAESATHKPAETQTPPLHFISNRNALACAVHQLSDFLPKVGFQIVRTLPISRRPLVTVVDGEGKLGECDVSVNNRLPLGNTQLLRAYSKLDCRLRPMVILIKTWAKHRRVCGADQGNLSSYAWTIMVIYFFQLATGLPSLQALTDESEKVRDLDYWGYEREFDFAFLPVEKYFEQKGLSQPLGTQPGKPDSFSTDPPLEVLLYGFFHFFSKEYQWGKEVVCIDRPARREAGFWFAVYGRPQPDPVIHVEDPIEHRDLNIVMRHERLTALKEELAHAAARLREGASLDELMEMADEIPYVPTLRLKRKRRPYRPPGMRNNLRAMR